MEPLTAKKIETQEATPSQPLTGVRVHPAPHGAIQINTRLFTPITSAESFLKGSCREEFKKIKNDHIIQSSFETISEDSPALPGRNGFVNSVVQAYNQHNHLIIRPEDVWFSILAQINIYINKNSEELRGMFVAHKGQKALKLFVGGEGIDSKKGTMFGIDWASFAYMMGKEIEENILDPGIRKWFMPTFSTTTKVDQATASILMMSTMQKYFSYACGMLCGLPSVTLLGRKSDWEDILSRLERLKTFGEEPTMFYELLRPVVQKFVETFDDPESDAIKDFWQHVAHYSGGGSGPTYLSGWITAFCFWSDAGKCLYKPGENPPHDKSDMYTMIDPNLVLVLDDARYHHVDTEIIPPGYASVPVLLDDNGVYYNAEMVAGSLGIMISSSGLDDAKGERGLDTVQPGSGWCMYEVYTQKELDAKPKPEQRKRKSIFDVYD